MQLKTKIISLSAAAILISVLFINSGCKTTVVNNPDGTSITNKVVDVQQISNTIAAIVPLGVQVAVGSDTNTVTYFNAATLLIDAAIQTGNYDAALLENTIKELKGDEKAVAAVQAGLSIYKAFAADAVTAKLEEKQYVVVLGALSDAIKVGLSRPPIVLKNN